MWVTLLQENVAHGDVGRRKSWLNPDRLNDVGLGHLPVIHREIASREFIVSLKRLRIDLQAAQQRLRRSSEVAFLIEADSDRKSTRLNSSHRCISYAVLCWK